MISRLTFRNINNIKIYNRFIKSTSLLNNSQTVNNYIPTGLNQQYSFNNNHNINNNNNNNNNNNKSFCTITKNKLLNVTKEMSVTSRKLTEKQKGDIEKFDNENLLGKGILRGAPDIFNGITVENTQQYPKDPIEFSKYLENSIKFWSDNNRRGVWLKIPQSHSNLISIAVEKGFEFHHCQLDYLLLTKWLPSPESNDPNKLPQYTSHFIGCGGVVINDKKEILLITEKQRPDKWKIPGGSLDSGEDICATAVREVFEETGVKTEFVSILGFRQLHNYAFNRGDIYYICALKPISEEINIDPHEIALCKWAPVEEFVLTQSTFPLQQAVSQLAHEYAFNGYKGFKASEVANSLKPGNSFVYHGSNLDFTDLKNKL
ncbi:hypothetical protein DICPUDRAFT_91689 [Dictyostelium purpureum]|uniref:Nucleoside diphosphate-linked moiety X motif 6 n=1 Tax=Dictyostelium purpureum TaxID=5786 RepID=F0ZFZ1_DICPU|nr:uncharacterized protein DICPUDRAFT_91689 [Dictyostelium purpureum]EGC37148.1 hypothetical protein DICPUDRAFT_91689 [Dictyostelium purpureum]|eukprot:XP_003286351.1 hypothetical protein DICPUDRAFT_91689 [Dictyostelium purpureum]